MSGRARRFTATEIEKVLKQYGFALVSQKGSHRKWRNEEKRLQVIVPEHAGRVLPLGTLVAICKGAELPEGEWRD